MSIMIIIVISNLFFQDIVDSISRAQCSLGKRDHNKF